MTSSPQTTPTTPSPPWLLHGLHTWSFGAFHLLFHLFVWLIFDLQKFVTWPLAPCTGIAVILNYFEQGDYVNALPDWLTVAIAPATSIAAMQICGVTHPPAGAARPTRDIRLSTSFGWDRRRSRGLCRSRGWIVHHHTFITHSSGPSRTRHTRHARPSIISMVATAHSFDQALLR